MARRNKSSPIEDLMKAPWWISAIFGNLWGQVIYEFMGSDTKIDFYADIIRKSGYAEKAICSGTAFFRQLNVEKSKGSALDIGQILFMGDFREDKAANLFML